MVDELDVYRTAKLLVTIHGPEAPLHAAMRYDELSASGDMAGAAVWKRVLGAVDVLLNRVRSNGAPLH